MDIGKIERIVRVKPEPVPMAEPVPERTPELVPVLVPARKREGVPA